MAVRDRLPVPDPSIHWAGNEDPKRGPRQHRLLTEWGLTASTDLLEIGCGTGRLAYELADLLGHGSYAGFDIMPEPIAWLTEHYASQMPNFRFDHLDISNPRWRPEGARSADSVRFPYDDGSFDLVCAFDVFMHMRKAEIDTYLSEIHRVLRPHGRTVTTWMVINERDDEPELSGRRYVPVGDGVHSRYPERDGYALAYDDDLARSMIADAGFDLLTAVEGRWHRPLQPREGPVPAADLFVAQRR